MEETREQRLERLCGAMERALVERREVSAERAKLYVDRARREGVDVSIREIGLAYLAHDFDLMDVVAE